MIRAALPHCCNVPLAKCPVVIGEGDVRVVAPGFIGPH
jgi:hypothetical protein